MDWCNGFTYEYIFTNSCKEHEQWEYNSKHYLQKKHSGGKKSYQDVRKFLKNIILYTEKMGNSCLGSSYALLCLGEPQLEASVLFWAWQHLKSMWTNERKSRGRQQEWVNISGNKTKAERCRGMVFSLQIEKLREGMVTVKYRKRSWKTRGWFVDRMRSLKRRRHDLC